MMEEVVQKEAHAPQAGHWREQGLTPSSDTVPDRRGETAERLKDGELQERMQSMESIKQTL